MCQWPWSGGREIMNVSKVSANDCQEQCTQYAKAQGLRGCCEGSLWVSGDYRCKFYRNGTELVDSDECEKNVKCRGAEAVLCSKSGKIKLL